MTKEITINAEDVLLGDELFSNPNGPPYYWWTRVRSVKPLPDNMVEIETAYWLTRKHRREAVTVKRTFHDSN